MPSRKNKKKKFHLQAKILLLGEDEDLKDRSKEASLFTSGWIFVCPTAVSTDAYCDRVSRCSRHGCFTRTFQVPSLSSFSFEVSFEADDSTRRNTTKRYELVQANLHSAVTCISTFTKVYFRRNCSLKRDDAVLKAWRVCTVDDVASMANYAKFCSVCTCVHGICNAFE